MTPSVSEIFAVIRQYADAYSAIQSIQETSPMIPGGDQKTGSVGEFYSFLFLSHKFPDAKLEFGNHSQKAWDIKVSFPSNRMERVQVKTVSAFSKTRIISPIHHGWTQLHVLFLNRKLQPTGFWVIDDSDFVTAGKVRSGCRCRDPEKPGTGSPAIPFGPNRIDELNAAINSHRKK
ncbi:MAG: hypothetical protein KDN19_17060 [Verrucomicrobiae bacterium]|nr:hypothetical protein [Verrucomicrobiae bacterium]